LTTTRTVTAAAIGLVTLALLTGCSFLSVSSAPDGDATAQAVPAPIEGDSDGDGELSEFEKQVLARNAPREITLHNGTVVVVAPGQPLPQPVIDQIVVDAAPGAVKTQTYDESAPMAGMRSLWEVATSYADELGRTLVLVHQDDGFWGTVSSVEESGGTGLGGTAERI